MELISGIGLLDDEGFEPLEEQNGVIYSQQELMRERLLFSNTKVSILSAGEVKSELYLQPIEDE